ncbi:MAG: hypothetical protein Tsb002_29160 [Wenzhouxiangellaceae bacterium]
MTIIRAFLVVSTVLIYILTAIACVYHGFNWPAVAINDLMALNWRTQFDTDFIVYLLIVATWIAWREGLTAKGAAFGLVSIVMGGMFSFPYILYATYQANGNPKALLLGVHS